MQIAFASGSATTNHARATEARQWTIYVFRGKEGIPGAADSKGHDTAHEPLVADEALRRLRERQPAGSA